MFKTFLLQHGNLCIKRFKHVLYYVLNVPTHLK